MARDPGQPADHAQGMYPQPARYDALRTEATAELQQPEIQPQPGQPLSLDDIAERVQRILDDPTAEADELDPAVLEALQVRRSADIDAAQQTAAADDELLEPTAGDNEQQDRSSSADPVTEAIEEAASSREQTDDAQVQYSRYTGRPISVGAGRSAGRSQGSRGRSHSR